MQSSLTNPNDNELLDVRKEIFQVRFQTYITYIEYSELLDVDNQKFILFKFCYCGVQLYSIFFLYIYKTDEWHNLISQVDKKFKQIKQGFFIFINSSVSYIDKKIKQIK